MTKLDIFKDAVDRFQRKINEAPSAQVAPPVQVEKLEKPSIAVPIDDNIVSVLSEVDPIVLFMDDAPGDPLSSYVACLKSLCNTTGGEYVDDDPNKAAGCYFRTNTEAAAYALLAWSCIPGGFLKWVLSSQTIATDEK
jgi:hypothetical protein